MFGKKVTRIDEHKILNLLEDCLVLRRSQAVQFGMVDVQISKQPLLVSSLQEPTDELPSPSLRHGAPSRGASRRSFNEIQVHRRNPSLDKVVPPEAIMNSCEGLMLLRRAAKAFSKSLGSTCQEILPQHVT